MTDSSQKRQPTRRADAARNESALLEAAAAVFAASGVDAPVREIATRAAMGVGTIYRHFPTRADLVVAVYRHQIDACAEAGPTLLTRSSSPLDALTAWLDLFVNFLVTKHGLAAALGNDQSGFAALHGEFVERLVPVCDDLLRACDDDGVLTTRLEAYELMRAIGNLCIHAGDDPRYEPRRLVALLIAGMRRDGGTRGRAGTHP